MSDLSLETAMLGLKVCSEILLWPWLIELDLPYCGVAICVYNGSDQAGLQPDYLAHYRQAHSSRHCVDYIPDHLHHRRSGCSFLFPTSLSVPTNRLPMETDRSSSPRYGNMRVVARNDGDVLCTRHCYLCVWHYARSNSCIFNLDFAAEPRDQNCCSRTAWSWWRVSHYIRRNPHIDSS